MRNRTSQDTPQRTENQEKSDGYCSWAAKGASVNELSSPIQESANFINAH